MTEPKIDFSQFHPLDHWPWERRCRTLYGGPRHHLHLAWVYRHKPNLVAMGQRVNCVLFNRHDLAPYWMGLRLRRSELNELEPSGFVCSGYGCKARTPRR